ncbi:peptidoglycan-binding protein [Streptomyces sp. NPDC057743]|uniref:peptidoglycan-binding protein n=1 Tax=Streptomyces sp. NPDC057743 TaxID=3346236 RepID=UPI00368100E6
MPKIAKVLLRLLQPWQRACRPRPAGVEQDLADVFPGEQWFRPGARNAYVQVMRHMLAARGAGGYFPPDVPASWSLCDLRACAAFQRAQGWRGEQASGIPNAATWGLLVGGQGRDIRSPDAWQEGGSPAAELPHDPPCDGSSRSFPPPLVPPFPGPEVFGPGLANSWILMLRLRLIVTGWAQDQHAALEADEGLRAALQWDEPLRVACARFQLAQGCRGAAASGYPTDETWRMLWTT